MPKTLAAESSPNTLNPALLALKPRQVLISRPDMGKESKTLILESEQKVILLRSIAQYLERCGFSKCFKKLLSEAEIEKKELNSTLPDLEAIYSQFLKKSHPQAVEVKVESGDDQETDRKQKKKEFVVNGSSEANAMEGIENVKKEKKEKKKKKKETKMEVTKEEKVKETDAEVKETDAEVKETDAEIKETDAEIKETDAEIKETDAEIKETDAEIKKTDAEIKDVVKEKKKKKNKSKSIEAESLGDDDKERVSKKRKRSDPEETKEQTDGDEESKRMKKEENVEDNKCVQETPVKQTNVEENGNIGKSDMKSTNQKSGKGLSNSKEPKKPFQRVNVEEIVFTDDRLKDNSYWAKDGADSGYGAKAQEVLGQVRGRGFRHEKTKKKRGSYRGGEIDLQSHSVKFDYSDEE